MGHPPGYYDQINAAGIVEEDAASLQIIPNVHGTRGDKYDMYLYVEKINFSVHKPAIGSNGICIIQSNAGDVLWKINVDGVKDPVIDWGTEGVKVGTEKDPGLQAVVSGADTQASVSVGVTAHYNRE